MNCSKYLIFIVLLINGWALANGQSHASQTKVKLPRYLKGTFEDDYGSTYLITQSNWSQDQSNQYKILSCNKDEHYLVVEKIGADPTKEGIYTRIDYMSFKSLKIKPWKWGYCYTAYDVGSIEEIHMVRPADRTNPKTGCNGYPFSRMKKSEKKD